MNALLRQRARIVRVRRIQHGLAATAAAARGRPGADARRQSRAAAADARRAAAGRRPDARRRSGADGRARHAARRRPLRPRRLDRRRARRRRAKEEAPRRAPRPGKRRKAPEAAAAAAEDLIERRQRLSRAAPTAQRRARVMASIPNMRAAAGQPGPRRPGDARRRRSPRSSPASSPEARRLSRSRARILRRRACARRRGRGRGRSKAEAPERRRRPPRPTRCCPCCRRRAASRSLSSRRLPPRRAARPTPSETDSPAPGRAGAREGRCACAADASRLPSTTRCDARQRPSSSPRPHEAETGKPVCREGGKSKPALPRRVAAEVAPRIAPAATPARRTEPSGPRRVEAPVARLGRGEPRRSRRMRRPPCRPSSRQRTPVAVAEVAAPTPVQHSAPAELAVERELDLARDGEWLDRLARDIARAGSE